MMFRPRESHDLRLIRNRVSILPQPAHLCWLHDAFDNSVAVASFGGEATKLRCESVVTLEHSAATPPDYRLEPEAPANFPSPTRPRTSPTSSAPASAGGDPDLARSIAGPPACCPRTAPSTPWISCAQ